MWNPKQANYEQLRDLISLKSGNLVAWVGAGLSAQAGLPLWSTLRDNICRTLQQNISLLEEGSKKNNLLSRIIYASQETNLWLAFEILRADQEASFEDTIKKEFSKATNCPIPEIYRYLWKLRIAGMVTLNIDRLAYRSYIERSNSFLPNEISGKSCANFPHILRDPREFIINLHGIIEDPGSWIFEKQKLNTLYNDTTYISLIDCLLNNYTIIFVGVSADDIAIGGHFDRIIRNNITLNRHFWITNRNDYDTWKWAETRGLRPIFYPTIDDKHNDLFCIFDDLLSYLTPEIEDPAPVPPTVLNESKLSTAVDLNTISNKGPEDSRKLLNYEATRILNNHSDLAYQEYENFRKIYGLPIHVAWYVSLTPPDNKIFEYTLIDLVAEGAFGRVYKAIAPDGTVVALKLLREDVGEKPEMLKSFRRGVRSMRILGDRNFPGVVPYIQTCEIPAFVVMELIDGPDLQKAVESKMITDWATVLRISEKLAQIIQGAHELPENVLHRDIRPANIMLKGYYSDNTKWDVVVLDFDMSWHKGSTELSVLMSNYPTGYLAPEQVKQIHSGSSRSKLVDSYGLGMTLYYLRTGREPLALEIRHKNWNDTLIERISEFPCETWVSLPYRYARLIDKCARENQYERWDMRKIALELSRLVGAEVSPDSVHSAELIAEEMAFRVIRKTGGGEQPIWDENRRLAEIPLHSGITIEFIGNEINYKNEIIIRIRWEKQHHQKHKNIKKYIPDACERACAGLKKHGFSFPHTPTNDGTNMYISLSIGKEQALSRIEENSLRLSEAIREFRFE